MYWSVHLSDVLVGTFVRKYIGRYICQEMYLSVHMSGDILVGTLVGRYIGRYVCREIFWLVYLSGGKFVTRYIGRYVRQEIYWSVYLSGDIMFGTFFMRYIDAISVRRYIRGYTKWLQVFISFLVISSDFLERQRDRSLPTYLHQLAIKTDKQI